MATETKRRQIEDAVGCSWAALAAEENPQGTRIEVLLVETGAGGKGGGGRGGAGGRGGRGGALLPPGDIFHPLLNGCLSDPWRQRLLKS